jgi:protease-4
MIIVYQAVFIHGLTANDFKTTVLVAGDAAREKIAVWTVAGAIDERQADDFEAFVREIESDPAVKAVVVRVDSPGGAVSPSDRMNRALARIKASGRPAVVSMGSVAASGGYFLSAAADWIYAEPSTITGSIGVISMIPVVKGATDLLGIDVVVIRSTRSEAHKAALNYFESPSQETIDDHRKLLDGIQEQFIQTVARGRTALGIKGVTPLADGRVWLGEEAARLGLVDEVGYVNDAVAKAASMASLSDPHVVRYRDREGLSEALFGAKATGVTIDPSLVDRFTSPRVMLLWRP